MPFSLFLTIESGSVDSDDDIVEDVDYSLNAVTEHDEVEAQEEEWEKMEEPVEVEVAKRKEGYDVYLDGIDAEISSPSAPPPGMPHRLSLRIQIPH